MKTKSACRTRLTRSLPRFHPARCQLPAHLRKLHDIKLLIFPIQMWLWDSFKSGKVDSQFLTIRFKFECHCTSQLASAFLCQLYVGRCAHSVSVTVIVLAYLMFSYIITALITACNLILRTARSSILKCGLIPCQSDEAQSVALHNC